MTKHSDIPFAQDSSRYFLPWISMLMIFIASLTLAGGLTAYRALSHWKANVSGAMTVQIPVVDVKGEAKNPENLALEIEQTLTVLRTSPGILGAKVLEEDQMRRLMTPWLGEQADVENLPLPKVIDVSVDTNNPPQTDLIKSELADQVPSAVLDTHRVWLDSLITMAKGFMKLTIFILGLLILTTAFTVIYSAKTSLSVHKKVVRLVHMMGANDFYIAWQYAVRVFKLTFLGGFGGLCLAFPVILGVGYFFETITSDFNCALDTIGLVGLICMPILFGVLSFITTLQTVLSSLKRML